MFKTTVQIFILSLVVSVSSFGLAHDVGSNAGAYLGVQGGYGGMLMSQPTAKTDKATLYGFSWRVYGGHLWEKDRFKYGLELGFVRYPKAVYDVVEETTRHPYSLEYKGFHLDFLGVLQYHFSSLRLTLFGKGGLAYVDQKSQARNYRNSDSNVLAKHQTKWLPKLAIGMAYHVSKKATVDLSVGYVFGHKPVAYGDKGSSLHTVNRVAPVATIMLGVSYFI